MKSHNRRSLKPRDVNVETHNPDNCNVDATTEQAMMLTFLDKQPFNGPLFGTTWVSQYQNKHSPTRTHEEDEEGFA